MGDNHFAALPTAAYGAVQLMSGFAYTILQRAIIAHHGPGSRLAEAVGSDMKGKASVVLYMAAIPLAFVREWIADALYVVVALMWLLPDRRIESRVAGHPGDTHP
jgi:uncharacterized membrane protein